VTTISIDVHKYGMAVKGNSVVAFATPELRRGTFCAVGVPPLSTPYRCLTARATNAGSAEIYLGSAAIGSQWVQPLRHGDPIDVLDRLYDASGAGGPMRQRRRAAGGVRDAHDAGLSQRHADRSGVCVSPPPPQPPKLPKPQQQLDTSPSPRKSDAWAAALSWSTYLLCPISLHCG
jgi:hypothetical protein